jgi:hypothetical protein
MKEIKRLDIDINKFYLIEDIDIEISELNLVDFNNLNKKDKNDFFLKKIDFFINRNVVNQFFEFIKFFKENKLIEEKYLQKLINLIVNGKSIQTIINLLSYNHNLLKMRLDEKIERKIFNDFYNQFLEDDLSIFIFPKLYFYVKDVVKIDCKPFEEIVLKIDNYLGGLKLTGLPYDRSEDEVRSVLNEIIFDYTISNRKGTWKVIGIKSQDDLEKIKIQVMTNKRKVLDENR